MNKEFKGKKSFQTQLSRVAVTVYYTYDAEWDDYEIRSILTEDGTELISVLDLVTDTVYHNLITEIYELEENKN